MHFTQLVYSLEKRLENPGCVVFSFEKPSDEFEQLCAKIPVVVAFFFSSPSLRSVSILLVLRDNDCGVSALHFIEKSGVSLKKGGHQTRTKTKSIGFQGLLLLLYQSVVKARMYPL